MEHGPEHSAEPNNSPGAPYRPTGHETFTKKKKKKIILLLSVLRSVHPQDILNTLPIQKEQTNTITNEKKHTVVLPSHHCPAGHGVGSVDPCGQK